MDEKNYDALFRQEEPRMRSFFHKKLKDKIKPEKMSETKTELVVRTCKKVKEGINKGKLTLGYCFGMLVTFCLKDTWADYVREMIRHSKKPSIVPFSEIHLECQVVDYQERYELKDIITNLIQHMPADDLELFHLLLEDTAIVDIAKRLKISVGAAKMRVCRLRKWMEQHLVNIS